MRDNIRYLTIEPAVFEGLFLFECGVCMGLQMFFVECVFNRDVPYK